MEDLGKGFETYERVARIFVSSTFKDMEIERHILATRVFPELRRRCQKIGVKLFDVDLRWGITQDSRVIQVCLEEVEKCRPYFICLLGDRYGWVPSQKELAAVDFLIGNRHISDLCQGMSITEIEILAGPLTSSEMRKGNYFYFRREREDDKLSARGGEESIVRDRNEIEKLSRLKEKISEAGLPIREFREPEALFESVLNDLWNDISERFPEEEKPDPVKEERAGHEAFASARTGVYIGRPEYFQTLDSYVERGGRPICITGESGSGKSALLANWSAGRAMDYPDEHVFFHFIGSTPQSADHIALMQRLMAEIATRHGITEIIPQNPHEINDAFSRFLRLAGERGRLIIVLDALNQLENRHNAFELEWLPDQLPGNVRLIVSALKEPQIIMERVTQRNWETLHIEPLSKTESAELINRYLVSFGRRLEDEQVEEIIAARNSDSPMFLKIMLDELRQVGKYGEQGELLSGLIRDYLNSEDIPALLQKILSRLENDFNDEYPGLVEGILSSIWASRIGLDEKELIEINSLENRGQVWSMLSCSLGDLLTSRLGYMCFFHDFLRASVEKRYIGDSESKQWIHKKLTEYFREQAKMASVGQDEGGESASMFGKGWKGDNARGFCYSAPKCGQRSAPQKRPLEIGV